MKLFTHERQQSTATRRPWRANVPQLLLYAPIKRVLQTVRRKGKNPRSAFGVCVRHRAVHSLAEELVVIGDACRELPDSIAAQS
jgi:uncharacterized ParB-like nuclease family protein